MYIFFIHSASNALTEEGLHEGIEWLTGRLSLIYPVIIFTFHSCIALHAITRNHFIKDVFIHQFHYNRFCCFSLSIYEGP